MAYRILPTPTHHHDKNTGQTFKEWLARPGKASEVEWYREFKRFPLPSQPSGPSQMRQKKPRGKGARSLVEVALSIVAKHFHLLEVSNLKHVPYTLIPRIWQHMINDHPYVSLQSLKIFAKYLEPQQMPVGLCRRDYKVFNPTGPLSVYMNPIISPSFDFIVHLTLVGYQPSIDTPQLLSLTKLKNLGVLEIIQPPPSSTGADLDFPKISDAIIRQWSEEPDPFPVLRVLKIWGDYFTTPNSLQYLSKFPALAVYDVAGLERDWGRVPQPPPGWTAPGRTWRRSRNIFETLFKCLSFLGADKVYHANWQRDAGILVRWNSIEWELSLPLRDRKISVIDRDKVPFFKYVPASNLLNPPELEEKNKNKRRFVMLFETYKKHILGLEANTGLQSWGYFLYCHIGHLWSDKDLAAQGVQFTDKAFLTNDGRTGFVVPPRPYVTLQLGTCCEKAPFKGIGARTCCSGGTERRFEAHQTFFRAEYNPTANTTPSAPAAQEASGDGSTSNKKKRPREPTTPSPKRMRKKPKSYPIREVMGRDTSESTDPDKMEMD